MKLYDKKFFISGNCMIRSFGQPGVLRVCQQRIKFWMKIRAGYAAMRRRSRSSPIHNQKIKVGQIVIG